MADVDLLPPRGVPYFALVDANGIAIGGTSTTAQLAAKGMKAVCQVDPTGIASSDGTSTVALLASRGIRAFAAVDENGVSVDDGTSKADVIRSRGIRPMVAVDANGLSQTGPATIPVIAQRGLSYFCPVDETGTAGSLIPVPPNTIRARPGIFTLTGEAMTPIAGYTVTAQMGAFSVIDPGTTNLVPPVPAFTLSGNVKSGAFAYWSTARAYNTAAATGLFPVMDLVDQTGAHPVTINLLATGRVNVASINSWVSANSVTTIKVAKLYDQTGNSRHVSQATLANMPVLKLTHPGFGNDTNLPVMEFTASANMSLVSAATGLSTTTGTFSFIARIDVIGQFNDGGFSGIIQAGQNGPAYYSTQNTMCMYNGTVTQYPALSDNFHAHQTVFNGASSFPVVDGTAQPSINPGSGTLGTPFTIGQLVNAFPLQGNIAEIRFDNAIWTTTDCSNEFASQKAFWFNSPAYEGVVASRCRRRETTDATNLYFNARSAHIASQAITALRVGFENHLGGTVVTTASVEYPAGTFTQLKFLGASSFTIPAGPFECFSDYANVSIPAGATFWIRQWYNGTGGAGGCTYNTWQNSFLGEATELSATSLTDKTMSGTIANSGSPTGVSVPAFSITGVTTNHTCAVFGDSIGQGFFDVEDTSNTATGYNNVWGYINRSLNAAGVPFANYCVSGTQSSQQPARLAMGKCSTMISEFGINDFDIGGVSSATLIANISAFTQFAAPFAKVYQTTVLPHTDDPGGWLTLGSQTPHNAATDTNRVAFNNTLRAGTTGIARLTGYINSAAVIESAVNSNKWIVTPAPPYTADGLHPNVAGHTLLTGSGIVPT